MTDTVTTLDAPLLSPTLEECRQRHAMARARARDLVAGLDDATFHRTPPDGGWSVAECVRHLVVSGEKVAAKLEAATAQARAAGRMATPEAARAPMSFDLFTRLFIAGTGPGKGGAPGPMKARTRPPFEPGDTTAHGRDAVLADFLALQDRVDAVARAADGLDLARVKVESVLAGWIRLPLGGWFVALAGHQERHLDQAFRARAAVAAAAGGGAP